MIGKSRPQFLPTRFFLLIGLILLVVIGLIIRIMDLSIFNRKFLQHQGNVRTMHMVTTPAFRGMITDRNGFPLAVSTAVYSVWMNPHEFLATPENIQALKQLLDVDPKRIQSLVQNAKKPHAYVYLKRGISPDLAQTLRKQKLPGVYLQEDYKRFYPEGEVAAHVVGFTNIDDKGEEGLELAYNDWLSGKTGEKVVIQDRMGRAVTEVQSLQEQKPGNDLTLSIDKRIQYLAYRELMQGVKQNLAVSGSVIVLDVQTGEVLAMVNLPSFNPNNRAHDASDVFRNRAVTDIFEPGSTMKAFSLASAIDSGKYNADSTVDTSPGWMRVGRNLVRDEHDNGVITLAQVLQLSSNVGATKMILTLPPETLWSMLHRVGFGEMTGIGFPGEQAGRLVNRPVWKPFALATLSFGYGMSVTALQLAQAYSIFANNGIKRPVSLIKLDTVPHGQQVISPKVAQAMLALLEKDTTEKKATGYLAHVPGYRVAGKTGTAHMTGAHGYEKHRYHSSFVGVAPVSHPRFVVAVVIHDPHGKQYLGGFVSAPVFEKIMEGTLRLYNIQPDA